jgi:hypothetical protein
MRKLFSFSDSNDTELPTIISDVDKYVASDAETLNIICDVDIGLTVDIDVDKQLLFEKDVWSHDAAVLGFSNTGDTESLNITGDTDSYMYSTVDNETMLGYPPLLGNFNTHNNNDFSSSTELHNSLDSVDLSSLQSSSLFEHNKSVTFQDIRFATLNVCGLVSKKKKS